MYQRGDKYWGGGVNFSIGSFDSITGQRIDWVIALGFIHTMDPQTVCREIKRLVKENRIENIILDLYDEDELRRKYGYEGMLGEQYFVKYASDIYKHTKTGFIVYTKNAR